MKAKAAVGLAVAAALTVAVSPAAASDAVPLTSRDGVVLAWQAKSKTAVVAMSSQKILVVHALRRYRAGSWIRLRGVKWGRAVAGVKWGYRPWGVKWAIIMARNGTYRSAVQDLGRVRRLMALRVVVLHRNKRRMVVSVPGASWAIRFGRRAVWLPGPKLLTSSSSEFGMTAAMTLRFDGKGHVGITKARLVKPAVLGQIVPVAGTVVARSALTRRLSLMAGGPSGVAVTLTVPAGVNLGNYPVGAEVSGTAATTPAEVLPILTGISKNGSFNAADAAGSTVGAVVPPGQSTIAGLEGGAPGASGDPLNVPSVAPTPPPIQPGQPSEDDTYTAEQINAITHLQELWDDAGTDEPLLIQNPGLYTGQSYLLSLVHDSIVARQRSLAILQLTAFELVVSAQTQPAIAADFKKDILALSADLRMHLLETL